VSDITKNALANSLTELMAATPLDKITVRMLVENCGLNRQTFYYHFQDISTCSAGCWSAMRKI